jgi:glycerate kinase
LKIVLAPDSYKGSLTAKQACDAMEEGIRRIVPGAEIVKVPMADGGEGTVQRLVDATGGTILEHEVCNPLGEPVKAKFGILGEGNTAVIEMAEASGLYLIDKQRRNPWMSTTYGTGELIGRALSEGCRSFILGIGGSATNDGGAGMAQALGALLLDDRGSELPRGGGSLGRLDRIDLSRMDKRLMDSSFQVACDVDNPLCGPTGASQVFGPQKGATPEMVLALDRNLSHYASIIARDIRIDVVNSPGAGAAGGLGAGALAFLKAELRSGVGIVMEASGLQSKMAGADLVFTGEGRCDFQTERGKTPYGVAKAAQLFGVPVVLVAGIAGPGVDAMYRHGVRSIYTLTDGGVTAEHAMSHAPQVLADTMERIMRLITDSKI